MKPNLVFLHGGPGFKDYLKPYFRELNESFECHFYDQLQGPNVELEDLIQQLQQIVVSLPSPVIVGHSWGGTLATEFALRYPQQLNGMVLMCSALSSQQWMEYHRDLEEMNLKDASSEELFLVPSELEHGRTFLNQIWSTFSDETFESINRSYIKDFDLTKKLDQIAIKFLNIYAENDLRIPSRIAESLRTYNPSILNYRIRAAGHFPFLQENGKYEIHQILRDVFSKAP